MSPASLSDFPVEVLIKVYKSLNSVKDVTALNSASHRLHNVWLSNTGSISDAVLSRTIESYDYACELVKIQQKFFKRDHGDDDDRSSQQVLEENKLMISNANDFRTFHKGSPSTSPRWIYSDENLGSKLYYCICMLVIIQRDGSPQTSCLDSLDLKTLDSLDLETLDHMVQLANWYSTQRFFCHEADDPRFPLLFGLEKFVEKFPAEILWNVERTLREFIERLLG